jgi:hypothetical protein
MRLFSLICFSYIVVAARAFLPASHLAERFKHNESGLKMKPESKDSANVNMRLYQSSTSTTLESQAVSYPSTTFQSPFSSDINYKTHPVQNWVQQLKPSPLVKAVASSTLFIFADVAIKHIFKAKGISFPSSLAGCCAMAAVLLTNPFHASMYQVLAPGARLLQKFLMVFLVPNLIVLPLCDGVGSAMEVRE